MRKMILILMLLSMLMISLLVLSCAPKQPETMEDETSDVEQGLPEASAKEVSDVEVEMELKKLSLDDLNDLIEVGEADKDKPLSQQAYDNPDWLTLAYKVKSEKLAEQSSASDVSSTNHAPVFKDFSNKDGAEGAELTFKVTATDEDGDALTYDVKDDPPGADLSKTGKFSWTPGFDKAGEYEMTFVVSDGKTTATKTITLTVANTNQPPKFTEEWELVKKLELVVNEGMNVFLAATDADGDVLTYAVKDVPSDLGVKLDSATGQVSIGTTKVEELGYPVTFTVTDGVDTVEKKLTVWALPEKCMKNIECPGEYYCQDSTSSCKAWDLTKVGGFTCENSMNTADAQDACVNKVISYWTDSTKGHNLCYKVDPVVTLNSCTVTKEMSGKYKYDCSFTATCDYSSLN